MYQLNDTIIAISSPSRGAKIIVRVTGPDTFNILQQIFTPSVLKSKSGIIVGSIAISTELKIDAKLYIFIAPHSYTGDIVGEIHLYTNSSVAESLIDMLLGKSLRMAEPGEFTARAYFNSKIDLVQAEAVGKIVASSNRFQLNAAQKLFAGRLVETIDVIRSQLTDCLSLIEAGLDFSQEDITFITLPELVDKLAQTKEQLQHLFSESIRYELVIDLPAVGIAGAINAGKSSLLNKLLGWQRSIVSSQHKTTRDVLTGLLILKHCTCAVFDCAGLVCSPANVLDELSQQAAIEALQNSSIVVFCVDISKADWSEDVRISKLIKPKILIPVATKADLLSEDTLAEHIGRLNVLFDTDFRAISVKTGSNIELLQDTIDKKIIEKTFGLPKAKSATLPSYEESQGSLMLTARHKQAAVNAIENITEAIGELEKANDDIAALMLWAAYQDLSNIEQHIDEKILENIFSRFCIGK